MISINLNILCNNKYVSVIHLSIHFSKYNIHKIRKKLEREI
jgi:hypothetical protein